jgi:hypothetical protein
MLVLSDEGGRCYGATDIARSLGNTLAHALVLAGGLYQYGQWGGMKMLCFVYR